MIRRYRSHNSSTARPATAVVALFLTLLAAGTAGAQTAAPKVVPPQPTVPEIFTLMGQYVRLAYNNEGFVTLGYRMVQEEIGREWVLLTVGITLRKPTPDYDLTRADLTLTTPDGKTIPLATQQEYQATSGKLRSLNERAKRVRDSINYFPLDASHGCVLQFFSDLGQPMQGISWDKTQLSYERACVGRLFFRVPGGIQVGQHWLNVKFAGSSLQVPFRTLTKDEAKQFSASWQDLKKELDASFK
jgi:hypothetical protein